MRKRILRLALALVAAFVVHVVAGRTLAGAEPVQALVDAYNPHHDETILYVMALLAARGFLYFIAPWWALHIVVAGAIQRYREWVERHGPLDLI